MNISEKGHDGEFKPFIIEIEISSVNELDAIFDMSKLNVSIPNLFSSHNERKNIVFDFLGGLENIMRRKDSEFDK